MLLKSKTLAERLVSYLARHPHRTPAEIQTALTKSGAPFSRAAVYKELGKLLEARTVVRHEGCFSLRADWVIELGRFAREIERAYFSDSYFASLLVGPPRRRGWKFTSLFALNDFWDHLLLALLGVSKEKIILSWNPHPWSHIVQPDEESAYLSALTSIGGVSYKIVGGRTPLDRWAAQFWHPPAINYSFAPGPFRGEERYINVVDDWIITISMDARTTARIDELFRSVTSTEKMNVAEVVRLLRTGARASMSLERSAGKAAELRRKFERFFGPLTAAAPAS